MGFKFVYKRQSFLPKTTINFIIIDNDAYMYFISSLLKINWLQYNNEYLYYNNIKKIYVYLIYAIANTNNMNKIKIF